MGGDIALFGTGLARARGGRAQSVPTLTVIFHRRNRYNA
jgi:hypothetical protein